MRAPKKKTPGNDLSELVERVISDYRAQNQITEPHSRVLQMSCTSSGRTGAYDIEEQNETAEQLLHQLKKDKAEKAAEQDRIELEEPPLLVLAKRVRTFTTYFCGMKKEKPVWSYQEFLAARLNFAQAEKLATTLGADVFAMPANFRERR